MSMCKEHSAVVSTKKWASTHEVCRLGLRASFRRRKATCNGKGETLGELQGSKKAR